jgi:hypothetical protein
MWVMGCGWAGIFLQRVAQVGVFCVCAVGFVEICENEATQEE